MFCPAARYLTRLPDSLRLVYPHSSVFQVLGLLAHSDFFQRVTSRFNAALMSPFLIQALPSSPHCLFESLKSGFDTESFDMAQDELKFLAMFLLLAGGCSVQFFLKQDEKETKVPVGCLEKHFMVPLIWFFLFWIESFRWQWRIRNAFSSRIMNHDECQQNNAPTSTYIYPTSGIEKTVFVESFHLHCSLYLWKAVQSIWKPLKQCFQQAAHDSEKCTFCDRTGSWIHSKSKALIIAECRKL